MPAGGVCNAISWMGLATFLRFSLGPPKVSFCQRFGGWHRRFGGGSRRGTMEVCWAAGSEGLTGVWDGEVSAASGRDCWSSWKAGWGHFKRVWVCAPWPPALGPWRRRGQRALSCRDVYGGREIPLLQTDCAH